MKGVRVPNIIQEKEKKDAGQIPLINKVNNLQSDSENSKQKVSSTYDIVDEVYQDIDDFEFRMSGNFKNK